MNLGELIARLATAPQDLIVPFGLGRAHSYRGYYNELAFEPATKVGVATMLAEARGAVGRTFTGYKGGDFTMTESTQVWLARYGDTGEVIGPALVSMMLVTHPEIGGGEPEPRPMYDISKPTAFWKALEDLREHGEALAFALLNAAPLVAGPWLRAREPCLGFERRDNRDKLLARVGKCDELERGEIVTRYLWRVALGRDGGDPPEGIARTQEEASSICDAILRGRGYWLAPYDATLVADSKLAPSSEAKCP